MNWIRVKDELPPDSEPVWVFGDRRGVVKASYCNDTWSYEYSAHTTTYLDDVTHWQHIVEPMEPGKGGLNIVSRKNAWAFKDRYSTGIGKKDGDLYYKLYCSWWHKYLSEDEVDDVIEVLSEVRRQELPK